VARTRTRTFRVVPEDPKRWDLFLKDFLAGLEDVEASAVTDFAETTRDTVAAFITNGTGITWSHSDGANTLTGTVSLSVFTTTNLAEGANLYFTDERAQDAVGNNLVDSASIDFTYNDGAGTITAAVLPAGVDHGGLAGLGDDDHPQYPQAATTETISGAWTFSAQLLLTKVGTGADPTLLLKSNLPLIEFFDENATTDEGRWQWFTSGSSLILRCINNAGSLAATALNITNSAGGTITSIAYGATAHNFSSGATEVARFDGSSTATHTRFMIYDVDNGTLERVTVGAADSGGVGFKVLRIPN